MAQAGVIRDFLVALGFQTDNAGLAKMQGAMAGVELKAKALNLALMSLATGAVIAVRQTASELDKLYFSSQRIGASATNITAFGNAISQMGGNAESALGTLEGLAEKMRNSPGYEGMLNGLGVSTKEANGDMRDRVEVMKDLSGVLSQMPAYQANAYAQSLGIDQNTLLAMRDGKFLQNMEKYQKIQKELGMNDDLTKSGNEFMTEYRDLTMMTKTGFQVIVMQAGKALIPVLRLLNQMIRAGIQAFSQLNPQIKEGLAIGLRFAFLSLVFGAFFKTFGIIFRFMPLLKGFIGLLKMMRLAFLASPIGIILALAAALAGLYDDYKAWKEGGKSLIDWSKWNDNLEKIMSKLRDFIELLNSVKDKVINFVQKIVSDPVSAVKEVLDTAKDALTDMNKGPISEPVKAINEVSKNIVDTAKGAIQKAKEVVVGGAKIINDEVKTTVKNSVNDSINSVGSYSSVAPIKSGAKGKKQIDFIKKYWSAAVKISQALDTKPEFLLAQFAGETDWGKKIIEGTGFNLGNIKASKNWKGGTVKAWDKIEKSYDPYRVYATAEEFADDYIKLVGNSKRYKSVKGAQDEKTFFSELKKSGYATDKEYVSKNLAMVKSVNNRLDQNQTLKTSKTTNNLPLDSIGLANFAQNAYVPTGNPNKDQVNKVSTNGSSSQVTINQNYQTDMIINGARDPVESAKAVKRQQENSMVIMARGAQGALP